MADRDERVAANEATFRRANEEIRQAAAQIGVGDPMPFVCECHKEGCVEILLLTADEYARVRETPTTFFIVPGHVAASSETVVENCGRYAVVEKKTEAARRVAEDSAGA